MIALRDVVESDLPRLVELNNAAVPAVPPSDVRGLGALIALSDLAVAIVEAEPTEGEGAERAEVVHAFMVCLRPGRAYDSENYRYFVGRGTDFLYVDRIVVDAAARGRGLGRRLYDHVFGIARAEGRTEVTCEVNVDPPNPESMAFHSRLGFAEIGRQVTKGGSVSVALLAAPVRAGG